MNAEETKKRQREERAKCLQVILDSKAKKKLIVAGAGTGKTYTFGKLLQLRAGGTNLAMTFIRKLVAEMETSLGASAEVKTFHSYCKKILHAQNGQVELVPFLTKIVEKDAELLERDLTEFDTKFRMLRENTPEISFHLQRGDYYDVVGFDDSVYRLYKLLQQNSDIVPAFDQIVIDEFQDFNPLEVAFIKELEKKGDILIVGDDDQAVYDDRSASPSHLREIYASPHYEKFELPFCSRCPQVIVAAANRIISLAERSGQFTGRIPKQYECFLDDKEADSLKHPKILVANCTTAKIIPKYVHREIAEIDPADIADSHKEGKEYPTVLIVGTRQYLREIENYLRPLYPQLVYTPSSEIGYGIIEAFKCLLPNDKSNLGWRILAELNFNQATLRQVIDGSQNGTAMCELLPSDFISKYTRVVDLIRFLKDKVVTLPVAEAELKSILGEAFDEVITHFMPKEETEPPVVEKGKVSILLTSFKGCKGLSAGHVFIVGVHNGSMPKDKNSVRPVEPSQFVVALTRTRKQCHIVSNDWLVAPKDKKRNWVPRFEKSPFVACLPKELVENRGTLKAKDLK